MFSIFWNTVLQFESKALKNTMLFKKNYFWLRIAAGQSVIVVRARGMLLPSLIGLELRFDRARLMFRPCSWYVSTVLDRSRGTVRPCLIALEVSFDRARVIFWPCSWNVSTVLEVIFDRTQGMFWFCDRPKPLPRLFFFGRTLTRSRLWKTRVSFTIKLYSNVNRSFTLKYQ